MPFDFWDDVVLPAWHDIARCKITHEAFKKVVMAIDEHHPRISRDPMLKRNVLSLKAEYTTANSISEDRLAGYVSLVITYKRGPSGVQNFIEDIQSSSFPSTVAVGGLLERIWEARKNDHPDEDVKDPYFFTRVVKSNIPQIIAKLATVPDIVLTQVFGGANLDEGCISTYRTACEVAGHVRDLPLCCQSAIGESLLFPAYSFVHLFYDLHLPDITQRLDKDFLIKIDREAGCGGSSLFQLLTLAIDSQRDRGTAISMMNDEGVIALREGPGDTVQADNGQYAAALSELIKEGVQLIPYGRLIMCGPGRTGKSSFLRSLLRQAFMSKVDSTIGVELEKVICTIEKQGLKYVWKQAEDSYQQQLALTHRAVGQEQRKKEIVAALRQQGVEIPKNTRSTSSMPSTPVTSPSAVFETEQADTASVCESAVSQRDEATHTGYSGQSATSSSETMDSQNVSTASKPEEVSTMSVPQVATAEQDVQQLQTEINSATQKFEGFIEDLKKGKSEVFTAEHLKNLTFIDVWDFAGQKLFAAIQHMVLACDRCAYAVVFDSSKKLQDRAKPTFGVDGEELPLSNSLEQTNFDVMETWFNAIHEVIGDSDNVPVFAIGTHVDKLPKKPEARKKAIEETEQYIWANAEGKSYANNIDKVVFVDNTRAGKDPEDPAVVQLRHDIIQQLQHQFSVPIPLRWLPVTISIGHIAKSFERPWLSVDELRRLAIAVSSISSDDPESDFQKMVKFHHDLGHLLHFIRNARLRDRVIIDIHWILKTMSLLFCPEPKSMQSKRLRPQYDLLTQNGILLESLAIHRWSQHNRMTSRYTATEEQRDFLFEMGEHFALFYNTKTTVNVPGQRKEVTTRKFFVPALVERVARVQDEVSKGKPSPAMYLYSGADRYFPQTLFWCGVVRCMQRYSPKVDPILYHTSARILVKDRFWLVMQYFQHGIRLSLEIPVAAGTTKSSSTDAGTRAEKSVGSPGVGTAASEDESAAVKLCHELLPYLELELDNLKAFSLTHVKFSRAVRCPCSFSRDACRKHKKKSCVEIGCQHFAPLVEGLRPRCPSGARPEVDISDVRQYWPCFSEDAQTLGRSDGKLDQSDLDLELVTGDAAAEAKGLAKVQQVTSGTVAKKAAVYHGALHKHYTAVQRSLEINVMDCVKSLRAEGHINHDCVKETRSVMKTSGHTEALDHLCCVLEELSDEGMCYFVESVLPFQGLSQLVETFQACPGPGKCTLKHHDLHTAPKADVKGKVLDGADTSSATSSPLEDKVQTGMSELHQEVLRSSYVELKCSLDIEEGILNRLYAESIITQRFCKKLRAMDDHEDQVSVFLEALPRCGAQAFHLFVTALKESEKRAHQELVDLLKEKLWKLSSGL
ncbi:uncharacterized protein LOC135818082 isoform X1 [Sycon ciliatum]|uniref:uncharacterized protein LOC135818082 isoform X1 n=1 Tax=Sycon ciliatum TaxID=27933 RepID=UPI0031F6194A